MDDIYSEKYQRALFNEMSMTYGFVNCVSSFGFNYLWRKNCLKNAKIEDGQIVCDLMSGMGEMGFLIKNKIACLINIDYSEEMVKRCTENVKAFKFKSVIYIGLSQKPEST